MTSMNFNYNIKYEHRPPDLVSICSNSNKEFVGFLVIENTNYNISAGGIRMLPDVTLQEIYDLAQTMSYKFAALDLPIGGAKAGIIDSGADHVTQIDEFSFFLKPFMQSMLYSPGADMGTDGADLQRIFSSADINDLIPSSRFMEKIDGIPFEDVMTGYGVAISADTTYKQFNSRVEGKEFALEGFGKVGIGTALQLSKMGAKITGISNIFGSIYSSDGFDIKKIIALRQKYGDEFIKNLDYEILPREKIFEFDVSGLILGTRPHVITTNNYNKIKAEFIIEAANIPITEEAEQLLYASHKNIAPDIVTNSGGVLSELMDRLFGKEIDNQKIFQLVGETIKTGLKEIYKISGEKGINPRKTAINLAEAKIENDRKKGRSEFTLDKSMKYILSKFKL
jgi:glutamate dehydrogenase (NAD(P)+)